MFSRHLHPIFPRQQGTSLIVVLVLIVLATVMALFAVKVNLSEQRASGADVRTRLMRESAEAALTQGMAYMQSLKTPQLDPFINTAAWTQCNDSDTTFPCGAVPKTGPVYDPATGAATTATRARRASMYYYTGSTFDVNGDGTIDVMEARMLPLTSRLTELTTTGNGFSVQYGVGAVVCALQMPTSATQTTIDCATGSANESGTFAYTLVAVGSIPGESAHTTVTQTIGAYTLLNFPPGAPPVVASGSVSATGAGNIVANPNAGGPGVPVSIWTRGAVDKKGNTNTCYYDEFIRNGAPNAANKAPTLVPALNSDPNAGPIVTQSDQIMQCDACQCQRADSLSFSDPGNKGQLGMDVLQCSAGPGNCPAGSDAPPNTGANYQIHKDEFPCDLFQYVFKTAGHKDADGDSFCEQQITAKYTAADGNPNPSIAPGGDTMGADERFLYMHAVKINPTTANAKWVKSTQTWSGCGSLGASDYGIYWDQSGSCNVSPTGKAEAGSVLYPLLLVADGSMTIKGTFFGLAFVRSTGSANLDPTTGGNGTFSMNANSAVYGAVVVQGVASKLNGSDSIIYSDKVLANIGKNSVPPAWGNVPGSWSDRFSY